MNPEMRSIPKRCLSCPRRAPDLCHMPFLDSGLPNASQLRAERRIESCKSGWDEVGVVSFQVFQSLCGRDGRETILAQVLAKL
jgi:hypothetical protein